MHDIGMRVGPARPRLLLGLIIVVTVALPGARSVPSGASGQQAPAAAEIKDGDWTMPGRTPPPHPVQRPHSDYGRERCGRTEPRSYSTGTLRGHEGQPLVVGDTLYVVTPYPNVLYAFDLSKDETSQGRT